MKPIPQHLYDRAELLSRSHQLQVVAQLIGKSPSTISMMKARGWKAVDYSCKRRRIPTDFAIQARTMTNAELADHYRTSFHMIRRWLDEKPVRPRFKCNPRKEFRA
jgi:hypothetical protein